MILCKNEKQTGVQNVEEVLELKRRNNYDGLLTRVIYVVLSGDEG